MNYVKKNVSFVSLSNVFDVQTGVRTSVVLLESQRKTLVGGKEVPDCSVTINVTGSMSEDLKRVKDFTVTLDDQEVVVRPFVLAHPTGVQAVEAVTEPVPAAVEIPEVVVPAEVVVEPQLEPQVEISLESPVVEVAPSA